MVDAVLLEGVFATLLLIMLVLGDWWHFTSLTAQASRYGCGVSRSEDLLPLASLSPVHERFGQNGVLNLPHGIARFFPGERTILLRPQYRLLSMRFRTAWPLKASIQLEESGGSTRMMCTKRLPWSSALITVLWFALVGLGTLVFAVVFFTTGGIASLSSFLMGIGITILGLFVLAFGLITVSLSYRLEDTRLAQAYQELRSALLPRESSPT